MTGVVSGATPGRLCLAAAILLHLVVVGSIIRQPPFVNGAPAADRSLVWSLSNDSIHRIGPGGDFFAVYHAGLAKERGHGLYGDRPEEGVPYFYPFRYLPIVADTLGAAATLVPPLLAWRLWVVMDEALLAVLLVMLWGATRRRAALPGAAPVEPGDSGFLWATALLLSTPYFLELHMGQFTFAAAALVAIGLLGLVRAEASGGRRIATAIAGGCLTLAALLKIFPAVVTVALTGGRRRRILAAVILLVLAGTSWPYFSAHTDELRAFLRVNFGGPYDGMHSGNYGVPYVIYLGVERLGLRDTWGMVAGLWRMAILGVTAILVVRDRGRDLVAGAVALLMAHFVTYTQVWEHHLSAVVALGALLVVGARDADLPSGGARLRRTVVACLVLLALPTPFALLDVQKDPRIWDPLQRAAASARFLLASTKAIPAAVLFAASLEYVVRGGGSRRERQPA